MKTLTLVFKCGHKVKMEISEILTETEINTFKKDVANSPCENCLRIKYGRREASGDKH